VGAVYSKLFSPHKSLGIYESIREIFENAYEVYTFMLIYRVYTKEWCGFKS